MLQGRISKGLGNRNSDYENLILTRTYAYYARSRWQISDLHVAIADIKHFSTAAGRLGIQA